MWFQAVMLTNASVAGKDFVAVRITSANPPSLGLHIAPNSATMSIGSLFAGWMMHRTGKYKMLNLTFGILPFIATMLIYRMLDDSGPIQSWLSIVSLLS